LRRKIGGVNFMFRHKLHGLSRIQIAQNAFPHILPVRYNFVMTKQFQPSNLGAPVSGGLISSHE
jgi:hypothetical protein